ncbi:MFS transporter [Cryobacterium roopkundense]|uniref:MFS transporter n=1 Tax=Cryobacterium roopkundense TaxID=1001240 RepID=UPI001362D1F4|nr:MFS transporter [Cryobacterium roopkundense]
MPARFAGVLTVPVLVGLIFAFGVLALLSDAAHQSFLPQLVPRATLVRANFRLQQSETAAQLSGSAVAGALIAAITAPFALLIDALTYFFSGWVLLSLRQVESNRHPPRAATSTVSRISEGLRWVYGHPRLGPLAIGSPIWFIGSAVLGTALPALVLLELGLGALGLGLILGCAGVGTVIGLSLSLILDQRFGTGRVMVSMRLLQPVAVAGIALSPTMAAGKSISSGAVGPNPADWPASLWLAVAAVAVGQFVFGLAMGVEGPLEVSYRQAVTPDRLLARMSATMRSVNRGMIVVGAILGGALATAAGAGAALWSAVVLMVVAGLVLAFSKFRTARIEHDALSDVEALA